MNAASERIDELFITWQDAQKATDRARIEHERAYAANETAAVAHMEAFAAEVQAHTTFNTFHGVEKR